MLEKELTKNNNCNSKDIKLSNENSRKNEEEIQLNELKEYKLNDLINKYDDKKEKPKVKTLKRDNKNT